MCSWNASRWTIRIGRRGRRSEMTSPAFAAARRSGTVQRHSEFGGPVDARRRASQLASPGDCRPPPTRAGHLNPGAGLAREASGHEVDGPPRGPFPASLPRARRQVPRRGSAEQARRGLSRGQRVRRWPGRVARVPLHSRQRTSRVVGHQLVAAPVGVEGVPAPLTRHVRIGRSGHLFDGRRRTPPRHPVSPTASLGAVGEVRPSTPRA